MVRPPSSPHSDACPTNSRHVLCVVYGSLWCQLCCLSLTHYPAIDFIDSLLVVDPSVRLTATQALQHKWLQDGVAPDTRLSVGGKMQSTLEIYKEQSRVNQPSSADT